MADMAWGKSKHNISILADEVCRQKKLYYTKNVLPSLMRGSVLRE